MKTVIAAEVKVDGLDQAGQSVGSFRKQLKEAQQDVINMADKFGVTSKQAADAAMKVAQLKDRIGDAKALADTFNPDKKFVALSGALQGATAGFSALTGAMGLFGGESDEVQKTLLKVQSAMALQQGISGIKGALDSFKLLSAEIGGAVVKAFSSLKGAIIASGIGALAIALGYVVANFKEIEEAISGVSSEQKQLNSINDKAIDNAVEEQIKVKLLVTEYQALGTSVGKKKEIQDKLQKDYPAYFGNLKTEKEFADGLSAAYLKLSQALAVKAKVQAATSLMTENEAKALKSEQALQDLLSGKVANNLSQGVIDKLKEGLVNQAAEYREKNQFLIDTILAANKELEGLGGDPNGGGTKTSVSPKVEKKKQEEVELEKLRNEAAANELADNNQLQEDLAAQELDSAEKERLAMIEANDLMLQTKQEIAELNLLNDPDSIDNKIAKINADYEIELSNLDLRESERAVIMKRWSNEIISIKEQEAAAKKKIQEIEYQQVQTGLNAIAGALDGFADLVGRETAAGRALAIAGSVIKTIQGGISAYMGMITAIPGPWGIALGIVAAAGVVASGAASIAKMKAVQIPGQGGGGGPTVPPFQAPVVPRAQTTQLNAGSLNAIGNAANRAYVLEHDVTNNQERITRLNRAARIN